MQVIHSPLVTQNEASIPLDSCSRKDVGKVLDGTITQLEDVKKKLSKKWRKSIRLVDSRKLEVCENQPHGSLLIN